MTSNTSYTLPFSHRRNISHLALNSRGNLLLTVDEDGHAILTNFGRRLPIYRFSFKQQVSALAFSPTGHHFAVGIGRFIEVWHTPNTPSADVGDALEFAPFVLHHRHAGHHDSVQGIEWSSDSRFFLSAAKDLTARIWSLNPEESFVPTTLAGHREGLLSAWFSSDQEAIYTVSQDGALFHWTFSQKPQLDEQDDVMEEDEEKRLNWRIAQRHFFMQSNAKVKSVAYHAKTDLLVAGFSNGIFGLYEMPDFNLIHTLSISQNNIDNVTLNSSGEWLAFGASKLGQLLVWEWQSESYILKQQGHFDSMNALAYSPDGQRVITAADDGKVKVWDLQSGFCVVTLTEHSSGVTACEFAKKGNVLFTSSLDGSVRAWDLIRYRNFRTFTAPTRLSFSSVAVDPSGEVVAAGSLDSFDIHIWSVQTGQLLDQLSGHEGPVSSLCFVPSGGSLVSGSWDHTVRIWSIFGRTQASEPLQLQADILCVAIRPDSNQIAVSTLDGQLTFWSVSEATQETEVDGRRDVSGGRKISDRRTAANVAGTKSFSCISYSTDGSCVIAGGNSKYMCLYNVRSGTLLKKYTVSVNLSLDGTQEFLNSRSLTEAGPAGLIDTQGEASDLEDRIDRTLPGATRSDLSVRRTRPEVRVASIAFSPTGSGFCAASTEGLLIYSLDRTVQFDPFDLDLDVTPSTTLMTLNENHDYLQALVMSFRLNEAPLIKHVYNAIPIPSISLVVADLPPVYLPRLLRVVAQATDESPRLEYNLKWLQALLTAHGAALKEQAAKFTPELRALQKCVARVQAELTRLSQDNVYVLEYLMSQSRQAILKEGEDLPKMLVAPSINGHAEHDEENMSGEGEWIGLDSNDDMED